MLNLRDLILKFTLAMLLVCCGAAKAVVLKDLYTFNSMVNDNTQATRLALLPQAMDQVLQRVAGTSDVLQHPACIEAKQNPDKYVRDFAYRENDGTYKLIINFDERMIDQLLASTGRGNLTKNRPVVMIWLAVQDQQKTELVGDNAYQELAEYIDDAAHKHGIPVVLPLLDLTERLFVSANDVAVFNSGPLQQAAGRYNVDMILAGKIKKVNNEWECVWHLFVGDQTIEWSTSGADMQMQMDAMLGALTEKILAHYGHATHAQLGKTAVFVRVKGVVNVAAYAKVMGFLAKLPAVKNVAVSSINDQEVVFAIYADGGRSAVRTAIDLDTILIADAGDSDGDYLSYRVN